MADPFVAEIRILAFDFPPRGWALCDGKLLSLAQNTALFSLLGTTYGGDGRTTFALPDLQGRAPMHPGQGPGLQLHNLGEVGGSSSVTLLQSEIPAHNHAAQATNLLANSRTPEDRTLARSVGSHAYSGQSPSANATMNSSALQPAGAGMPHNNMQPYLTTNFCIALQGVFPPRP